MTEPNKRPHFVWYSTHKSYDDAYGANIRTNRMILLSINITDNLFVQCPMSFNRSRVVKKLIRIDISTS